MDFYASTLSGVVGGLIATLIVVVVTKFWSRVIEPWYEEKVYKDAQIEGHWTSKYMLDGESREGIWEIHRVGHSVTINVTRIRGHKTGYTWKYVGSFKNLILTATYTPSNKRLLDRGAITLMLVNNGDTFRGWLAYYNNAENKVCSVEYELQRMPEVTHTDRGTPPTLDSKREPNKAVNPRGGSGVI